MDKSNAHYEGIMYWYKKEVITGYRHDQDEDTREYRPSEKLSRSHTAVLLSRVLDLETPDDVDKKY